MSRSERKPLHFVGTSIKALRAMPAEVQDVFGAALLDAQYGDHPEGARPFGEGVPREVMKLVEDFNRDTFRAAYTVAFPEAVYVLHVFKKSRVEAWALHCQIRNSFGFGCEVRSSITPEPTGTKVTIVDQEDLHER